jgi:predicted dehydrogenase
MVKKIKNFVLFGGNFASKVLRVVLSDLSNSNYKIHHVNSSKKIYNIPHYAEVFFIAIPPNFNLKLLKDRIPNFSNVFLEKPLSNSFEEAKKIKIVSIEKSINIFVDFSFNFISSFERLAKILINENVISYEFIWKTKTLQNNYKNNWKHDYRKGGGGLSNYVSHIISYLLNNFGSISLINSTLRYKHMENCIFDDSSGEILCKHANNIIGKIKYDIFSNEEPTLILEVKTHSHVYKVSNNLHDFFKKFNLFCDNHLIFSEDNSAATDARIPIVKNAIIYFLNNPNNNLVDINHALEVSQLIDLIRLSSQKNKEIYAPKIFI